MAVTIVGIDPGLRATGWGAIGVEGSALSFLGSGTITSRASDPLAVRLAALYEGLGAVLDDLRPDEAAVEQTFVSRDAVASLKLGQARGVAMLAPAVQGVSVAEYAPNLIKKTVVGAGHADKRQIRHMVAMLLPKASACSEHAYDALAVAICHASHRGSQRMRAVA